MRENIITARRKKRRESNNLVKAMTETRTKERKTCVERFYVPRCRLKTTTSTITQKNVDALYIFPHPSKEHEVLKLSIKCNSEFSYGQNASFSSTLRQRRVYIACLKRLSKRLTASLSLPQNALSPHPLPPDASPF